ncbi:MAG: LytR/AlgR family response regulator transcription factor, partial [Pseudomonadales bacterium]
MTAVTVAVSVPLFHIYVDVGLSGFELAIHTLVIFLCAILAWKIIWEVGHFIEARRQSKHLKAGVYWLLAVVFLPISFAGASYFQDAFAVTSAILAKHQSAGYERTLFLVVPFVLFPVWLIFQSGRLRMVRSSVPAPATRENESRETGSGARSMLCIRVDGEDLSLLADEIVYIKSEQNYCRIFVRERATEQGRPYMVRMTLKQALAELQCAAFVQTHRCYLVNIAYVEGLEGKRAGRHLRLKSNIRIPVSRARDVRVLETLRIRT